MMGNVITIDAASISEAIHRRVSMNIARTITVTTSMGMNPNVMNGAGKNFWGLINKSGEFLWTIL
jgi:hypothetical protein